MTSPLPPTDVLPNTDQKPSECLVLPAQTSVRYLAEGAANVVYRFEAPASLTPPLSSDINFDDYSASIASSSNDTCSTPPPTEITPATSTRSSSSDPSDSPPVSPFKDRLLRLRKTLSSSIPNAELVHRFHDIFTPIFPSSSLVSQELVLLPRDLTAICNARLHDDEAAGHRIPKRRGLYLAEDEPHGVLVTDMTPRPGTDEVLVEFKPKWLAQSPNAPPNARRCRTCALRAQKNALRRRVGEQPETGFCPLDLMSDDPARVRVVVRHLLERRVGGPRIKADRVKSTTDPNHVHKSYHDDPNSPPKRTDSDYNFAEDGVNTRSGALNQIPIDPASLPVAPELFPPLEDRLVRFLTHNPTLRRLRDLQREMDPRGVLDPSLDPHASNPFLIATTSRDCTVFIRVSPYVPASSIESEADVNAAIEARLGDLDFKSPAMGKALYWRDVERRLIDGGWYSGTDDGAGLGDTDEVEGGQEWCHALVNH
ncbi:MAG: hypothetical protein M1825_001470 [Sarcosagium campestre]|nr:MAG: hypothetical protein M1825_001470 [Sarcosagium campestre]